MATTAEIFHYAWLQHFEQLGVNADLRRCHSCDNVVRLSAPQALFDPRTSIGHDVQCPMFDYAAGLGIAGTPAGPGLALDQRTFWTAFLEFASSNDTQGLCVVCEGIIRLDDPQLVQQSDEPFRGGHDPDCQALAFANTLGFGDGDPPSICMFGSPLPVFGSSELWFGTTCGGSETGDGMFGSSDPEFGSMEPVFGEG